MAASYTQFIVNYYDFFFSRWDCSIDGADRFQHSHSGLLLSAPRRYFIPYTRHIAKRVVYLRIDEKTVRQFSAVTCNFSGKAASTWLTNNQSMADKWQRRVASADLNTNILVMPLFRKENVSSSHRLTRAMLIFFVSFQFFPCHESPWTTRTPQTDRNEYH
jgi:hypothetical protein